MITRSLFKTPAIKRGNLFFSQLKNKEVEPNLESGDGQIFLAGGAALIAYTVLKEKEKERNRAIESLNPLKKRNPAALSKLRAGEISPELLNTQSRFGLTFLWWTIQRNDYELAKEVITHGADAKVKTDSGETLLMTVARARSTSESIEFADYLIEKGVDINATDKFNFSALNYAVDHSNFDMALLLLSKGAKTTTRSRIFNSIVQTPKDLMISSIYREQKDHSSKPSISQTKFIAALYESTGKDSEVLQAAIEQAAIYKDAEMSEFLKSL